MSEREEASDPNTPVARLIELLETHADEVLANPALALNLVEESDLWKKLEFPARRAISMSPRCPVAFAEWTLRRQPEDTMELLGNRSLPVELRRRIFTVFEFNSHGWSNEWMDLRPSLVEVLTEAEVALLERAGAATQPFAEHPDPTLTDADLETLSLIGRYGRWLTVSHPRCSTRLLSRLWDDADMTLATQAIRHPNVRRRRLKEALRLSSVENETIRRREWVRHVNNAAWTNPKLRATTLNRVSEDTGFHHILVRNPSLPTEAMCRLAKGPDARVREQLAHHPSLSPEAQRVLAEDRVAYVREALLSNPLLTSEARLVAEALDRAEDAEAQKEWASGRDRW